MEATLLAFVRSYLGKAGTGDTPGNRGQCVGLIEVWLDRHNLPHIWGNAKDLLANAPPAVYTVVQNGPVNYPSCGDVVVWDASWGGGYGHTAVAIAATSMQLVVFEQNDPDGAPPLVATHGYEGVAGWLHLSAAAAK